MLLQYHRCPSDPNTPIVGHIGTLRDGHLVEVGIAEIASALSLQSAGSTVTLAIKNGVTMDYTTRTAMALAALVRADPHVLCPLPDIISSADLILQGQEVQMGEGRLLYIGSSSDSEKGKE